MDEDLSEIEKGDALPAEGCIYRIALIKHRDRRNKMIPSISCFSLSKYDDNKLSVDWEKKTTPEETIARVGASYKMNTTEYKPYENREIYALEIDFLNSITEIEKVVYDPIYYPQRKKGQMNNPAHSVVIFTRKLLADETLKPEIYLKIREHAKTRRISVDMPRVKDLVEEYRHKEMDL